MKRCPACNQFFDDENLFCLNDGSPLNVVGITASDSAPTQVLQTLPVAPRPEKNKSVYRIIGLLLLSIIFVLSFVIYRLVSKPVQPNEVKAEAATRGQDRPPSENKPTGESPAKPEKPPIAAEAVRELIARWEKSQDMRDFNAYRTCYAPQFFGVKRTKSGRESRMNYAQWLSDRQKMFRNTIDVGVRNLEIATEDETATARFIQQFQSVNYQDEGQKILKIKMFDDGAKIIYEELKYSY